MEIKTYPTAQLFLDDTQAILESQEALNSLMLGVCLRLALQPQEKQSGICLKALFQDGELVLTAVMTPPYKMLLSNPYGDLDRAARALIENLLLEHWKVPGVQGASQVARHCALLWNEMSTQKSELERQIYLYELKQVTGPPPEVEGLLRSAGLDDLALLVGWQKAFQQEALGASNHSNTFGETRQRIQQGDLYLWQNGEPVSMAVRNRPTRHGISISYVYTPPQSRRKGYAYALVYQLSQMLLNEGREFCTLFADQANPSSNRIYQRIGYQQISAFEEYTFT